METIMEVFIGILVILALISFIGGGACTITIHDKCAVNLFMVSLGLILLIVVLVGGESTSTEYHTITSVSKTPDGNVFAQISTGSLIQLDDAFYIMSNDDITNRLAIKLTLRKSKVNVATNCDLIIKDQHIEDIL
jgi:hypothetical protein